MSDSSYWNTKLEKIQYALHVARDILDNGNCAEWINKLEKEEDRAAKDLVESEQEELTQKREG